MKKLSNITENNQRLPRVAVVSVTYNRCDPLLTLLSGLCGLDYPSDLFDIYLVDNASADDTVARVRQEFPEVRLTVSNENLGTSAGFNIGMRDALITRSDYDFIWLLDSDAEVESSTLTPMIEAMLDDASIGIVGSTVYDPENRERMVTAGLQVNWRRGNVSLVKNTAKEASDVNNVDLVAACSLLIRTEVCRSVGLWDEIFWIYWGDTDWCQRVIHAGYRVCCHVKSRVWHRDWANTQRNFNAPTVIYDDLRGGLLFNLRHHPRQSLNSARYLLLKSCFKSAIEQLTMRGFYSIAYEEAIRDLLHGDFKRRGLGEMNNQTPVVRGLDNISSQLSELLPCKAVILLNQLTRTGLADELRRSFNSCLDQPQVKETDYLTRPLRSDFTTDYRRLTGEFARLIKSMFLSRCDVIVGEIGNPHIYTLTSARYTVLIDDSGNAMLQRNHIFKGFFHALKIILRGIGYAYIDLPRACRKNHDLQRAISGFSASGDIKVPAGGN